MSTWPASDFCTSAAAASLTFSTPPSLENKITGSGMLSIAAWAACWANSSSPSELLRYSTKRSAMALN